MEGADRYTKALQDREEGLGSLYRILVHCPAAAVEKIKNKI